MKETQSKNPPNAETAEIADLKRQVHSLTQDVERLQDTLASHSKLLADLVARNGSQTAAERQALPVGTQGQTVTPDVLLIISAAVSAFLGKKIRIRSARMLQSPYEIVNPWSQQGRVSVQASHMLHHDR